MDHCQTVSYYSERELLAVRHFHPVLTGDRLLFRELRSVEHPSIDISMFIEISLTNICPIKPYPVKA